MQAAEIGMWGLGVMGRNLAVNLAGRGFAVVAYERDPHIRQEFARRVLPHERITPAHEPKLLFARLKTPRKIMVMVKAGEPVDAVLEEMAPYLAQGDVVIDGGNSHYQDTIRRCSGLTSRGVHFLGCGVSGGEQGALTGPAIMAGGSAAGYAATEAILTAISAQIDGEPCCARLGDDGAGHFVKMVHNGIEYGCMQLIGEAYQLLRDVLQTSAARMHQVFADWNRGALNSYLMEITADILSKTDPQTGRPLLEMILDRAGQKGTGAWASQTALTLGVAAPTLAEAVFARCLSALKEERVAAATELSGPGAVFSGDAAAFTAVIRDALHAATICCYAQGFALLGAGGGQHGWELDLGRIARLWRGGCIIRARLLEPIADAYARTPQLPNLLLDQHFKHVIQDAQHNWRQVVATAAQLGAPAPALSSALAYFDSYRNPRLCANLIQAQRDYFGAHTYERIDGPGVFHTDWAHR